MEGRGIEHVLISGATGFLGSALARVLCARGRKVHALFRAGSERGELEELPIVWHAAELREAATLERAFGEARQEAGSEPLDVAHCAALVSYRTRDEALAREVNVEGTRRMLACARAAGARRFLHVSSVVTLGPARRGEILREDSARRAGAFGVHYVDTKRAAEDLALAAAAELDVVVASPAAIFGASSARANSGKFLRRMRRRGPWLAPPGGVGLVGVDDAAEGCALALERGARGRRYLLAESSASLAELIALVARLSGVRAPLGRLPLPLWSIARALVGLMDRVRPLDELTPQAMRMLGSRFGCSGERARTELGWRPRPIAEVLRAALEELQREQDAPARDRSARFG